MKACSPDTLSNRHLINAFAFENFSSKRAEETHARMPGENQRDLGATAFACNLETITQPFNEGRVLDKDLGELSVHVSLNPVEREIDLTEVTERVRSGLQIGVLISDAQRPAHLIKTIRRLAGLLEALELFDELSIDVTPHVIRQGAFAGEDELGRLAGVCGDFDVDLRQIEFPLELGAIRGPIDARVVGNLAFDRKHELVLRNFSGTPFRFGRVAQLIRGRISRFRQALVSLEEFRAPSTVLVCARERSRNVLCRIARTCGLSVGRPGASAFGGAALRRSQNRSRTDSNGFELRGRTTRQRASLGETTLQRSCVEVAKYNPGVSVIAVTRATNFREKSIQGRGMLASRRSYSRSGRLLARHIRRPRVVQVGGRVQGLPILRLNDPALSQLSQGRGSVFQFFNQVSEHRPFSTCYACGEHRSAPGSSSIETRRALSNVH